MKQAHFTVTKKTIVNEIKKITQSFGQIKNRKNIILEITTLDNGVQLEAPGINIEIEGTTQNHAKAAIPLLYFKNIVESIKDENVNGMISEGELKIGIISIQCETNFYTPHKNLKKIKLPINYTDLHLLQLENKEYTLEELKFNNLIVLIHQSNKRLANNINKVSEILSVYGVSENEIREMINKKIKI